MMDEKLNIRATAAPWHAGVDLLIIQGSSVGRNVVMERVEEGLIVQPTVRLGRDEAQTLMDDLWNAGIRPTEGAGSAGSLRATEKHLADMRLIAFRQLGIDR